MSWWDNYKARFKDNLKHAPGETFSTKSSKQRRAEQEERLAEQRRRNNPPGLVELRAYLAGEKPKYDAKVNAERARGNKNYPYVEFADGWLGNERAVIRYNEGGSRERIDIFYGGAGTNPLNTPPHDYHGHIVIIKGDIKSWLEPGPEGRRNRLY